NASVVVEARFKSNVKYPLTPIAAVTAGSEPPAAAPPQEGPQKKSLRLGGLKQTVAPGKESARGSAPGGARGLGADRAAKGGSNPGLVRTSVSAAELDAFKKGIA